MTFLECLQAIDKAAEDIVLKYYDERLLSDNIIAIVANHFGEDWNRVYFQMENKNADFKTIAEKCVAMIKKLDAERFKLNNQLARVKQQYVPKASGSLSEDQLAIFDLTASDFPELL